MKLRALDQLHISSVKSDTLRPGEEFEMSDAAGEDLVNKHPDKVKRIDDSQCESADEAVPILKSEAAPKNKAEVAPANKADQRKRQGKGE